MSNGGAMAEPNRNNGNPPPLIGRAGRYTVFIKAPPSPQPGSSPSPKPSPKTVSTPSPKPSPKPVNVDIESQATPVPTPSQAFKPLETSLSSFYSMFSSAISKIQNAHSAVDEYLADWFGLNQSKYQWALNEYLEMKGMEMEDGKPKETTVKGQEMQQIDEQVMKRDDQPSS
eukprot:Gb_35505 [translate_table: standard]